MSAPEVAESSRARQEADQEPESEPQRKWVALVSAAVLLGDEDERAQEIVPGTDVLLDLNDPPLPSYLVLHPGVAPDTRRNNEPLSAYILAADRSACFLLQVVEGNRPDFFICNTHRRTVTILPPVPSYVKDSTGLDLRPHLSIGLIADPHRRGHYVVAQLHPTTSDDHPNKLLCYSTAKGQWFATGLGLQRARMRNPFSETSVLAHDGRLWWIALAYGVFFCDPFMAWYWPSQLRFLPLPDVCEMEGDVAFDNRIRILIDQRRCVRPSEGKLRFVEIRGLSYDVHVVDVPPANPTVWMWTLDYPEGPDPWTLEYEVAFAEIWANKTYADSGLLPFEVPHVALVDPNDHYVVYFFQGSKLFGFDMREKKVVACKQCLIDRDQLMFRSSRPIVDAWELPPPPPTLPGDDDSSPDDNVWSIQSYTEKKKRQVIQSVDSWLNQVRLEWTREADESWRTWPAPVIFTLRRTHQGSTSSPAETLNDDVVAEILVRLPPEDPENLVNAALVCTQWGRVASSRGFRSQFRNFHSRGGPRILGLFCDTMPVVDGVGDGRVISRFVTDRSFIPVPRDRRTNHLGWRVLDSRHGRVLFCTMRERWALFQNSLWVWCPISGEEVQLPPVRRCPKHSWSGALVCGPAADDGVDPWEHLGCHREPFRVVLMGADEEGLFSCIYSSDSDTWSPPLCAEIAPPREWLGAVPAARVGNMLCFILQGSPGKILRYDMVEHSFVVIERPPGPECSRTHGTPVPISLEDGRLGLAVVYELRLRLWAREVRADGEAWVQIREVIELDRLLPNHAIGKSYLCYLVGFADGIEVVFLWTPGGLFLVNLRTGQVIKNTEFDGIHQMIYSVVPFLTYCMPTLRGGYGIEEAGPNAGA